MPLKLKLGSMNVGGIITPSGSGSFVRGVEITADAGGELEEDDGSSDPDDAALELGAASTGITSATTGAASAAGVGTACGGCEALAWPGTPPSGVTEFFPKRQPRVCGVSDFVPSLHR